MDWIIAEFKKDSGIDLTKQPDAVQRIKEEAEKAKIALSSSQEYEINLPFVTADASGPKHIQKKLTRVEARAAHRRSVPAHHSAGEGLSERCAALRKGNQRTGARRRHDPHAEGGRDGATIDRQGTAQGSEPGRSRRDRRRHSGRRAQGRRQRRPPLRRDSAHAGD